MTTTGVARTVIEGTPLVDGPTIVTRQRLVDGLDLAVLRPVTAITAPAGSGKSVLVDQWLASRPDVPAVALRLRPDDDRARFTRRVVGAVIDSGVDLDIGAARRMHHARASGAAGAASSVLDELTASGPVVVVLDDIDAPSDPDLVADLQTLALDRRPGVHLVVTARSRRAPSLLVLRRRDDVGVLDGRELAFTGEEVTQLVRQVAVRELGDRQVEELLDRTEGWAVAVQLAAVALRGGRDADAVIATISGENPHIAAFLEAQVLRDLPPMMRRFLVRTSLLDPLTGPVCDAVTDGRAGALTLRYFEHRGVPVHRLAPQSPAYRYPRLLREHLHHQLRMSEPGAEGNICRRAARWHADHADPEPAARYLAAVEDWEALAALVATYGRLWYEGGAADRVLGWLAAVPAFATADPQDLALRLAYLHTMMGRTRRAEQVLRDVEVHGADRSTAVCADALRATWAFIDASPAAAADAAHRALVGLDEIADDELPDVFGMTSRSSLRTMAAGSLAKCSWLVGDVAEARRALRRVLARRGLYAPWRTHLMSALALLEAWEGNLRAAERLAGTALRFAHQAGLGTQPAIADAFVALGHVRRERGDLRRASAALQRASTIANRFRRPTMQAAYTVEVAALSLAAGVPDRGLDAIRSQWVAGEPPPPPIVERHLRAAAVRSLVATGRLAPARSLLAADDLPAAELAPLRVALAVAEGSPASAEAELANWPPVEGRTRCVLDKQLWTAIVHQKNGRRPEALRLAADVIAASEAEGHSRFVLDAGAPGVQLLRGVLHAAPTAHARRIADAAVVPPPPAMVAVDLSEREREVVRYLPTPLTNAEMAARLYVSLNTLKTHLRAIYRKLGVRGRREAIRRAEELGIA